jgi:hypothetical protein
MVLLPNLHYSFNPKPEAMADSGMDRPPVAPAVAFGFGLNEQPRHGVNHE